MDPNRILLQNAREALAKVMPNVQTIDCYGGDSFRVLAFEIDILHVNSAGNPSIVYGRYRRNLKLNSSVDELVKIITNICKRSIPCSLYLYTTNKIKEYTLLLQEIVSAANGDYVDIDDVLTQHKTIDINPPNGDVRDDLKQPIVGLAEITHPTWREQMFLDIAKEILKHLPGVKLVYVKINSNQQQLFVSSVYLEIQIASVYYDGNKITLMLDGLIEKEYQVCGSNRSKGIAESIGIPFHHFGVLVRTIRLSWKELYKYEYAMSVIAQRRGICLTPEEMMFVLLEERRKK